MEKISFPARDGYTLSGFWAVPIGDFKGTAIISPATGVPKEYYSPFAQYLVNQGYRVFCFDYRGIGGSAPKELKNFHATMHDWGLLDMNAALDFVVTNKEAKTVVWVGHSVGAQMHGMLDKRNCISKVIAISSSIGYWNYFFFPYNIYVLLLWKIVGPLLILGRGYAPMKKIGWGEDIPKGVFYEWRQWCFNKEHYKPFLQERFGINNFADFTQPITAIHPSDDYIANSKTVAALLEFFPNAEQKIIMIRPSDIGVKKIGHMGIFRKRFQNSIWPLILNEIE
jgi:predicted alpha/beta hydrolase